MPSFGKVLRFQYERDMAIQCSFLLLLLSSLAKEKNATFWSVPKTRARAQHLLCKHLLQLATLLQHESKERLLTKQGPPHPLHSQSCSPWWVCVHLRSWSCLPSGSILPETGVFSLPLAMGLCTMIRIWGREKILFQLGCLCANISFRAIWGKSSLHWNTQLEVVVCVSTMLRWYPLKIQNWGTFLHLLVLYWQLCMGWKPILVWQIDIFCLVPRAWSSSLLYPPKK